jgi:hypothetical protein
MCMFGSSPPKPAPAPTIDTAGVAASAAAERRRRALAAGQSSTILTSGAGDLSPTPAFAPTLLGS